MPSLSIRHQPLRKQFEQHTDVSRHYENDGGNRQLVDWLKSNKGRPLQKKNVSEFSSPVLATST